MEILSRQCSDVAPSRHIRPVLLQHLRRIVGPLALTDRCESGGFGGQIAYSPKVENIPGTLVISKTDAITKAALPGTRFKVLDESGNVIKLVQDETLLEYIAENTYQYYLAQNTDTSYTKSLQKALEEEAMLEAVFSKDYSTEVTNEKEKVQENDIHENTETDTEDSNEPAMQAISLVDALKLEETDVIYQGYEVTKSYPEATEDIYFTMDATNGNELVVLKFSVTNTAQSDREYDILSQGVYFKIVVNGESHNALTTMLLNDLANYRGAIAAGTTEELVLVCEVPEEKAANIGNVTLQMKTTNGLTLIALD